MSNLKFPLIEKLDDILKHIEGLSQFKITKTNGYIFIKYTVAFPKIFPNPINAPDNETCKSWQIRRECRGIVFDAQSKKLVARRFHKFFNIDEMEETKLSKINFSRPFVVMNKLDGSLISPIPVFERPRCGGDIIDVRWATMNGFGRQAQQAQEFVDRYRQTHRYRELAIDICNRGATPILEWTAPENRIVVQYSKPTLSLTGIRYNRSGEYFSYEQLQEIAHQYNVPIPETVDLSSLKNNPAAMVKNIRRRQKVEGVVFFFQDDCRTLYKLKTRYYLTLHKIGSVLHPQIVWMSICDSTIDDVISASSLSSNRKRRIEQFRDEMEDQLSNVANRIEYAIKQYINEQNADVNSRIIKKSEEEEEEETIETKTQYDFNQEFHDNAESEIQNNYPRIENIQHFKHSMKQFGLKNKDEITVAFEQIQNAPTSKLTPLETLMNFILRCVATPKLFRDNKERMRHLLNLHSSDLSDEEIENEDYNKLKSSHPNKKRLQQSSRKKKKQIQKKSLHSTGFSNKSTPLITPVHDTETWFEVGPKTKKKKKK